LCEANRRQHDRNIIMARAPSFNFGLNRKPRKSGSKRKKSTGKGRGSKGNAWRKYVVSNAPIPD
jgi:hypothetical protein